MPSPATTVRLETVAADHQAEGDDHDREVDDHIVIVDAPRPTIAPDPVMPLTGLPITDPALAARPAVVVKVSNDPGARPQSGLQYADIVFEAWGAGPTRFATVFQSQDAPKVGPIRLARTQDVDLVGSFNGAVFACSGGKHGRDRRHPRVGSTGAHRAPGPGWYLDKNQAAARTPRSTTRRRCAATPTPTRPGPAQQYHYRRAGDEPPGDASAGFKLHIEQVHVAVGLRRRHQHATLRSQEGKPHADRPTARRSTFDNVVVLWIDYEHSPADARSPDGGTIGTGAGRRVHQRQA